MDISYLHPRRTFNPELSARYGRPTFPLVKLVKYSPKYGWARVFNFPYRGSHWRPRMHTVVLSVDGPCTINTASNPKSQAAWSVVFGRDSQRNRSGLVPRAAPQTNSRAALEAVRQAVLIVRSMKMNHEFDSIHTPFKEIIIRTTSEYIVKSFHEWVWTWENNGWRKADGDTVAHARVVREIHNIICELEEESNMAVRFWHTERDGVAEALAKHTLGQKDDSGYGED